MDGATVTEQLVGAARSNNETLIESIIAGKSAEEVANIINNTHDPVGNTLLHLAAHHGSLEVLDLLLDQEGVEIDPVNRLVGNTPLHQAVEFARGPGNQPLGLQIVDLLIECGADSNVKNSAGKRAIDLAIAAQLTDIINSLRGAQYAAEMTRSAEADGTGAGADADGEVGGTEDLDDASESE